MKAIFREKRGNIVIEDVRDIPEPYQIYRYAKYDPILPTVISDGSMPLMQTMGHEITFKRIGIAPDGTPIYEN